MVFCGIIIWFRGLGGLGSKRLKTGYIGDYLGFRVYTGLYSIGFRIWSSGSKLLQVGVI